MSDRKREREREGCWNHRERFLVRKNFHSVEIESYAESKTRRGILCVEIQVYRITVGVIADSFSTPPFSRVASAATKKRVVSAGEERVHEEKFSHADLTVVALTDRDGNANHVRAGAKFVV